MPAYLVVRIEVTDWEKYRQYAAATPAVISRYGGRFIIRGAPSEVLEGEPEPRRLVVIEFPTLARVKEFYNSPEYRRVKELRADAAHGQFLAVDGFSVA